ncbi:MAG: TetR/AcrR family transcriptional regulator [Bacteroidota bacterium]
MAQTAKRRLVIAQKENSILDAAGELFVANGYESTTLRKIAAKVEINPATIYNYYKSKEEIFFALQKRAFSKFYEEFADVRKSDARGIVKLRKMGRKYVNFALKNQNIYELMFIMKNPMRAAEEHDPTWEIGGKNYELLKETLQECIEEDSVKFRDVESGAFMIWSMIHGLVSLVIMERCQMMLEENLEYVTREAHLIFERLIEK